MKLNWKGTLIVLGVATFFLMSAVSVNAAQAVKARFDVNKMSDMSDFDPTNPVIPTGDTIKIAVVASFSGPAQIIGENFFLAAAWAAHDYNKRGGIWVDGKKKLIQLIKADHAGNPAQAKKVCEQMALEEKVHAFWGADGSHIVKIMNDTASKYKIISHNFISLSDVLMNATNFTPYAFMTMNSTSTVGKAMAYYYGQVRKKEKKFYILNQDYLFGRSLGEAFKNGLKEYYPGAEIVGEDYHKLFLTDFNPYLIKLKASGAEVLVTGDMVPDAANLMKQLRQMGIMIPVANVFIDQQWLLKELGVENTKGLQNVTAYGIGAPAFKTKGNIKFYKAWNNAWKKWKAPFNGVNYQHPGGVAAVGQEFYWLLSVIERAKSTNAEAIIKVWEDDVYQYENGHIAKLRACDHMTIQDLYIQEFVPPDQQKVSMNIPPYYWYNDFSWIGPTVTIPAAKVYPPVDPNLERCKGK